MVRWFVGIDWAAEAHEVCVIDHEGQVVQSGWRVEHTAVALQAFVEALLMRAAGDLTTLAVGIEVPRGAVVELLVERGLPVYAINPKQVDRFRDRFTTAGAKDDARDAHVIATALRTDRQAFRRVKLDHPLVVQIREWSRLDDDLGNERMRLAHQLRDVVYRVAPHLLRLCPGADEPWFWALLTVAPTPREQRRLTLKRVERLLLTHRIRRLTPVDLRTVLQEPAIYTAPGVVDAVTAHLTVLLPRLELVGRQRRRAAGELERLLDAFEAQGQEADQCEHPDVAIVRSMPGIGTRVAARMLAEASPLLVARAYHALRAVMGTAPVTKRSGRRQIVLMRRAVNHGLREAAYHWARVAAQKDHQSHQYYGALRARGHSHGRALRSVADRLLRILMTLLERHQLFDPARSAPAAAEA